MKQVVYGVVCSILIMVILVAIMTVERRTTRENEMDDALGAAVDKVLTSMEREHLYSIDEPERFAADFCRLLMAQLHVGEEAPDDDSLKITVDVTGCDYDKGLLGVHVTETFTHPNGKSGKLERDAAALLETNQQPAYHTVTYLLGDEVYASYSLKDGEALKKPEDPVIPEQSFLGWMDADTHLPAVFSAACGGDKTYTAIMHEKKGETL